MDQCSLALPNMCMHFCVRVFASACEYVCLYFCARVPVSVRIRVCIFEFECPLARPNTCIYFMRVVDKTSECARVCVFAQVECSCVCDFVRVCTWMFETKVNETVEAYWLMCSEYWTLHYFYLRAFNSRWIKFFFCEFEQHWINSQRCNSNI